MDDIETRLRVIAAEPVPGELAEAEALILERVRGHSFAREPLRLRAAAVTFALLMGVGGGLLPEREARPDRGLAPLAAIDLAPSTLLVGGW